MGHTRLGVIPKTRKWSAVIATIFGSGDEGASGASLCNQLPDISRILIDAIGVGLVKAKNDKGVAILRISSDADRARGSISRLAAVPGSARDSGRRQL